MTCTDCKAVPAAIHYVLGASRCGLCSMLFDAGNRAIALQKHAERQARAVSQYWGCPYCGAEKDTDDRMGCCGESEAHYEFIGVDENGEPV